MYLVQPPSVREALVVMEAAPLAWRGDADAAKLLRFVLKDWVPPKLYESMIRARVQDMAITCLMLIEVEAEEKTEPGSESGAGDGSADYENMIALYMGAYHLTFVQAMAEPWPAFVKMLRQISTLEARAQVLHIESQSIPYIKNKQRREERYNALMDKAGMNSRPRKVTEVESAANMKEFELIFAQAGALGRMPKGKA